MWVVADLDDDYIARMEDVLESYERPQDPEQPVVCLDEKPITLHADLRPPRRRYRDEKRGGITNISETGPPTSSAPWSPKQAAISHSRRRIVRPSNSPGVVFEIALQYMEGKTIHLVLDNLNIHRRKSLTDLFGVEFGSEIWNRFTVHYTPTHGSWLNQAEIEIGLFARECLGRRRIPDLKTLRRETRAWNRRINRARTRIKWRFNRKTARQKFGYKRPFFKRSQT